MANIIVPPSWRIPERFVTAESTYNNRRDFLKFLAASPLAGLTGAKAADAVLFGAVGDWKYDKLDRPLRPEQAILGLRKHLGLFANFRPAICYEQLTAASSLKPELIGGLDILIIRELTGDIYFGQPRGRRTAVDGQIGRAHV